MKKLKTIYLKLFAMITLLVLMFVQVGPYLLYADENEMTFSHQLIDQIATNEYYNTGGLYFSEAYLDQNPAYCVDYARPVPVANGQTLKYLRTLSATGTAALIYGYPNVTASSLGVNSKTEARLATQMAMWRLAYSTKDSLKSNFILDFKNLQATVGNEERLERVVTAAERIVERAIAVPYYANPTLNVVTTSSKITLLDNNKMLVGPFKIDGRGYNISSVNVALKNQPDSAVLCDASGNVKQTFSNQQDIYIKVNQNVGMVSFDLVVEAKGSHNIGKVYGTGNANDGLQDYCFLATLPDALTVTTPISLPELTGSIKVLKTDQHNTPLEGVEFELKDSTGKVVKTVKTDASGLINFTNLKIGKYVVKETSALEGYIMMDMPVEVEVEYNVVRDLHIKNTKIEGGIKLIKVGEDGKTPVAGVTFQVLDANKNVIDEITTNSEGIAAYSNLAAGTYYLKEVSAIPEAHVMIDETEREIKITNPNTILEVTIKNYYTRGKLTVHKTTEDNKPIEGVVFDILNENKEVIDTITTDANGNATTAKQLKYGTYYYQEKSAPSYVVVDTDMKQVVMEFENKTVEVKNNYSRGKLQITKTGDDGSKLSGVVFNVLNENKEIVDTITTNEEGIAISKQLVVGKYYYQEISCDNPKVIIDTNMYEFDVVNNGDIVKEEVENELRKMGRLQITKTGDDGRLLEGISFNILNENKEVVDTITTDANGIATSKYLPLGKYYYKELPSQNKGVIVDETEYEFDITKDEEIVKEEVVNELIRGSLTIFKIDENGNYLNGVTFTLVDENGKEVGKQTTTGNGVAKFENILPGKYNFKEIDAPVNVVPEEEAKTIEITLDKLNVETTVKNNFARGQLQITKTDEKGNKLEGIKFNILNENKEVVDTITTNKEGIAISKGLVLGKYYYKELPSDNKAVIVDETEYEFSIIENNEIVKEEVVNELKRGSISIFKIDEAGNYLEKVTFTLVDENGKEIESKTTGKEGIVKFENLLPGKYSFKEVDAPLFVVKDETPQTVEITVDELNVEVTVENKFARGTLRIHKTDMADNNLPGVTFEILDSDKNVVDTKTTDKNGILETIKLPIGKYYYREVSAEDENIIINTKLVKFEISENDQVVEKEVKNKTVDGVVIITKVDADDKNIVLSGAEIQILDANKNVIDTLTTDENGQVKLGKLKVGTYYYKETVAPKGYILDSNEYEFKITKEAQTREITFKNEAKKLPQTGGFISTNMLIVIIVAVVSIVGYITITLIAKARQDN